MRFFVGILISAALIWPSLVLGQENSIKRSMSLGWEEVPDSIAYELELVRVLPDGKKRKPLVFKTKTSDWSGQIAPGTYEMRLRAIDDRSVPGDWSDPSPIQVPLVAAVPVGPTNQAVIKSNEDQEQEVKLEWQAVPGAVKYVVEVLNEKSEVVQSAEAERTSAEIKLAVGKDHTWRVAAISSEGIRGEVVSQPNQFTLIGKTITPPAIEKPDSKFVTKVAWAPAPFASKYDYRITRKTKAGKWVKVAAKKGVSDTEVLLDPKKPGGLYRLEVTAHGEKRESSAPAAVEFNVYQGLRTPAAIETAKLREAMELDLDHYFVATYLLTQLTYLGTNYEYNSIRPAFTALAGTGRIGYGYMPKGKWGFVSNVDMSGVILDGKNRLFASADFLFAWRTYLSQATQFRLLTGGFYKEVPELLSFPTSSSIDVKNISFMGPALGAQVWHSLTYKLGVQLNLMTNLGILKVSTPSGGALNPSLTTQAGVLFSYRLKNHVTGFAGVAKRQDKISYKAKPQSNPAELNFAKEGDVNSVSMDGTYLNLYMEWGF